MPILKINGQEYEVPLGKRLVLAIEDAGIPILHRCGGWARCTTCRVVVNAGEPEKMTAAEEHRLHEDAQKLYGRVRLACQILCDRDMEVTPIMTLGNDQIFVADPGQRPQEQLTPEPVWNTHEPE